MCHFYQITCIIIHPSTTKKGNLHDRIIKTKSLKELIPSTSKGEPTSYPPPYTNLPTSQCLLQREKARKILFHSPTFITPPFSYSDKLYNPTIIAEKALSAATTNNTPQPPHLSLVEKHTNIYIKLHNNTLLQQVPRLHLDVFRIHSTGFIIQSERIKNHFFLA